jgi:hypothetical protein
MKKGSKAVSKHWRAAPLPFEFHLALDNNKWEDALRVYQLHPYHTAPADTYDLLKQIMYNTKAQVDVIKQRFQAKLKLAVNMQKRAAEEIDWATYWTALNSGDSKTISMALCGAKLMGVATQIGVAEACAALLKASDKNWHRHIVEEMPFSTVTRSNLVMTCMTRGRWDLACEMMRWVKLTRPEVSSLWTVVEEKFTWTQALLIMGHLNKIAVPYSTCIPHILENGCSLELMSQHLEFFKVLGNSDAVSPLLNHAIKKKDWEFVAKGVEHLSDIGIVTQAAHRAFKHLCGQSSVEMVCTALDRRGIPLHHITVELLEEVKVSKSK